MRPCLFSIFFTLSLSAVSQAEEAPEPILFPNDAGVLNITDFGAIPDDNKDDTKAIQETLDQYPGGNRIVYLPPGRYLVRNTLKWPGTSGANNQKRTILQGAGQGLTTLHLPENTRGFSDEKPKALIWTGSKPAQRFRNAVRDLTIEIGKNNRNAIGLQFNASNQGCIRNVTIRAEKDAGKIGLDLGHTDEIGPLLVRNLTVDGFEIGISTKWPVNSNTFEHVHLINQRRFGWWNYHQMIFVRGLVSENGCTTLYNEKNSWGTVTLLDSHIHAPHPNYNQTAILNERQLYLRNVEIFSYRKPVDNSDKGRDKGDIEKEGVVAMDTSHKNVVGLFRKKNDGTFPSIGEVKLLPVKEIPEVPRGDLTKDWVNLVSFGADPTGKVDATEALQKAIDSGKKTIYLPAGANFRFDGEVLIRGPVQRLIGLEGRFTAEGTPVWKLVDGNHPGGLPDAPVVVIERMTHQSGGLPLLIRQESKRTLVVSSTVGFNVEGHGTGDLFLDDFCGHLDRVAPGQSAWCRQLNSERKGVKCRNAGGKLWILGLKTESLGTLIETTGGGHTEVNGVFLYSNSGWEESVPAFVIKDSTAAIFGVNERNFNRSPVSFWVSETQAGETKELRERPWVYLSK